MVCERGRYSGRNAGYARANRGRVRHKLCEVQSDKATPLIEMRGVNICSCTVEMPAKYAGVIRELSKGSFTHLVQSQTYIPDRFLVSYHRFQQIKDEPPTDFRNVPYFFTFCNRKNT